MVIAVGIVCIISVIFALTARDRWWIRMFDYPRLEIATVSLLTLLLAPLVLGWKKRTIQLFIGLLTLAVIYQAYVLYPYFLPVPSTVPDVASTSTAESFSLLEANVLMGNRDAQAYLALVDTYDPDLLLVIEPDHWWSEQLQPLRTRYPHYVEQPQENYYGISLYSRFPLTDVEINYFENNETPSIFAHLQLPSGTAVAFYGLHPRPPLPENSVTLADKELLKVAQRTKEVELPVLVTGDFNDVPWSYTLEKFQELSGLHNFRVGRGFYNTFDAHSPIMRLPIDHIYLSPALGLVELAEPLRFSSDHFALFVRVAVIEDL
ncbi:MAG: endonuclease/exonuclease/phosphatase family protein [Caldilineaceae bacterium]